MKPILRFATRIPKIDWWSSRLGVSAWALGATFATVLWFSPVFESAFYGLDTWLLKVFGNNIGSGLSKLITFGPPVLMLIFGTLIGLVRLHRTKRAAKSLVTFATSGVIFAILVSSGIPPFYYILVILVWVISGIRALTVLVRPVGPEERFPWNPSASLFAKFPFITWFTTTFGVWVWSVLIFATTYFWGALVLISYNLGIEKWLRRWVSQGAVDWFHFWVSFAGFGIILFLGVTVWNKRLNINGGSKRSLHVFSWMYGLFALLFSSLGSGGLFELMVLACLGFIPAVALIALHVQLSQPAQETVRDTVSKGD